MADDDDDRAAKDDFQDFLFRFLVDFRRPNLLMILQEDDEEKNYAVAAEFMPLKDAGSKQMSRLMRNPRTFLPLGAFAVVRAQKEIDRVEKLTLNGLGSVKKNVALRIYGEIGPDREHFTVPTCQELDRLVRFTGTVIRATLPRVVQSAQEFLCRKCHHRFVVGADPARGNCIPKPARCPSGDGCNGTQFSPIGGSLETGPDAEGVRPAFGKDFQELKVQELVQKLPVGRFPTSVWVELRDDLVDSCKAGDDVTVTGVVMQRFDPFILESRCKGDIFIMGHCVSVNNDQSELSTDIEEYQRQIKSFWKRHRFSQMKGRDDILASLCPQIYGLYLVKLSVMLVMIGGIRVRDDADSGASRQRGESHLLLVGDPGTGKSQFLKYAAKVMPRSVITTGIGSTSAGLTATAIKDSGVWTLEAGALVLADGGICCIDEFNSIKECDKTAIHEAMEQQTISVAKAGLLTTLNSRCSILAATNPKGKFDPNESVSANVAIASPLLSRFDLVLVLVDNQNQNWDKVVAEFILSQNSKAGKKRRVGKVSAKSLDAHTPWPIAKMRAYVSMAKKMEPEMTREAEEILNAYYVRQRQTDLPGRARTTVRLLESLIRLAQAHARLLFREKAVVQDAVVAVSVMEASILGGAICGGVNPLHASFPCDPDAEYEREMRAILSSLGLEDIEAKERQRLNEIEERKKQWVRNERITEEMQSQLALRGEAVNGGGCRGPSNSASNITASSTPVTNQRKTVDEENVKNLINLIQKSKPLIESNSFEGVSPIISRRAPRLIVGSQSQSQSEAQELEKSSRKTSTPLKSIAKNPTRQPPLDNDSPQKSKDSTKEKNLRKLSNYVRSDSTPRMKLDKKLGLTGKEATLFDLAGSNKPTVCPSKFDSPSPPIAKRKFSNMNLETDEEIPSSQPKKSNSNLSSAPSTPPLVESSTAQSPKTLSDKTISKLRQFAFVEESSQDLANEKTSVVYPLDSNLSVDHETAPRAEESVPSGPSSQIDFSAVFGDNNIDDVDFDF